MAKSISGTLQLEIASLADKIDVLEKQLIECRKTLDGKLEQLTSQCENCKEAEKYHSYDLCKSELKCPIAVLYIRFVGRTCASKI